MFDWNDEELTNIIWGEAGESDDHIVPYPDQIEEKPQALYADPTKKETSQEASNVGPVEHKTPAKSENRVELDSSSKYDLGNRATGFCADSWPGGHDTTSSSSTKADQGSIGTATTNSVTKSSYHGTSREETAEFDKNSEIFENPVEDGEQGDFVDYGWANIGSFDDLDRIFSNNDPIFGDMNVGNANELWSSSKEVSSSPLGPRPLSGDTSDLPLGAPGTSSDRSKIKAQYMLDAGHSFMSGYDKVNEIPHHCSQDEQASIDTIEYSGGKSKLFMKEKPFEMGRKFKAHQKHLDPGTSLNEHPDKGNRQKRFLKGQKSDRKSEAKQLPDLGNTWSASGSPFQQVNSQYAPVMVNSSAPLVLSQPRQLQRPEPLQQNLFASSTIASPFYGNVVNYYPAPSVLAQYHPGEGNHDVMSSYDVPPGNANSLKKLVDASVAPPPMTPKEKIEKLRRRQQMRAILAIQKQQQQFGNQVSFVEHPTVEGGSLEVDESLGRYPSLDPSSPIEQDDSNSIRVAAFDNSSMEESVLYRLQDTISKLDVQIRFCIRDSLFRLAQSAMQRQYPSDTSSANTGNRNDLLRNKDIDNNERFARMPDVETDTNPIDRTVAHLLFHRPLEYSGKHTETPDSPASTGLTPFERKESSSKTSAKGYLPESFENAQLTSPQGSKAPAIFSEGESDNSACLDTSENAANKEAAEPKLETSK